MTIHKSKGLEFPVCFVVRCGQYFSARSYSSDLIFEKRAGVSMKLYHRKRDGEDATQFKTDTTLRAASALAVKLSEREEEMRVLYVAMTRARERLYLVGMGNGKPFGYTVGDRFATLSCNCYMKWILAGLEAHPELGEHIRFSVIPAEEVSPEAPLAMEDLIQEDQIDPVAAARYAAILAAHSEPTALDKLMRHVPTKVPASRMKEGLLDDHVFYETDLERGDGKLPRKGQQTLWQKKKCAGARFFTQIFPLWWVRNREAPDRYLSCRTMWATGSALL